LVTSQSTAAMPAQECSALWSKVLQVYDAAQASGAATKTDTKVIVAQFLLQSCNSHFLSHPYDQRSSLCMLPGVAWQVYTCSDAGVTFVLRIASALKFKPKGLSGRCDAAAAAVAVHSLP
jgi:hypothetical protein